MVKYGTRDQSGKKKRVIKTGGKHPMRSVAQLSNADIVKKEKFRPREYGKVQAILRKRGLVWT